MVSLLPVVLFSFIAVGQLAVLWFSAYKILSVVFVLCIGSLLWVRPSSIREAPYFKQALLLYACVYIYIAMASQWAPRPLESMVEVAIVYAASLPPLVFGYLVSRRYDLGAVAVGIGMMPIFYLLQAIYNLFVYDDPMLVDEFSIRTLLGGLTCLLSPLLLGACFAARSRLSLVLFLVCFVLALSIQSRGALLIVAPAVLVVLFYCNRRMFAVASLVLTCVLVILGVIAGASSGGRLSPEGTNLDVSDAVIEEFSLPVEERVDFDRRLATFVSLGLFVQSPLFGSGYSSVLQTHSDEFGLEIVAHGFVPGMLGELGLFGMFIMVLFFWQIWRLQRVQLRSHSAAPDRQRQFGYAIGFAALICYGFFHQTFESAYFSLIVGVMLGAARTEYHARLAGGSESQVVS